MFKRGKALLAAALAGFLMLGLQAPAHAKTAESDTRLAVANTVTSSHASSAALTTKLTAAVTTLAAKMAAALTVTVVRGDTLSGLAYRHCGSWYWTGVYNDNRAVVGGNPDLIYPGQVLVINCATGGAATTPVTPKPAPVPTPVVTSNGWYNPLPGHTSYCNFWQWRGSYNHRGEDIPAASGTPIHAVHAGNVRTQWDNGGGNMTIVTHDGMAEVYMHQSSYAVRSGWVNGGQVIGYVGSTGDSTGPHLHLEIQPWGAWNGVTSPDKWLSDRGVYIGC